MFATCDQVLTNAKIISWNRWISGLYGNTYTQFSPERLILCVYQILWWLFSLCLQMNIFYSSVLWMVKDSIATTTLCKERPKPIMFTDRSSCEQTGQKSPRHYGLRPPCCKAFQRDCNWRASLSLSMQSEMFLSGKKSSTKNSNCITMKMDVCGGRIMRPDFQQ